MTVSLSTRLSNNKKLHTITIAHKKKNSQINTFKYIC